MNRLIKLVLFSPEHHKIVNSLSFKCLVIKIVNDNKKEKGINLVAIANRFRKEYWKYTFMA